MSHGLLEPPTVVNPPIGGTPWRKRSDRPVTEILDEIGHAWKRSRLTRGIATLVCVVGAMLLTAFLCDLAGPLPPIARTVVLIGSLIAAIVLFLRGIVRPLADTPTRPELAAAIERKYPALQERLMTVAELAERDPADADPSEAFFEEQLLAETRQIAGRLNWSDSFSTTAARRWLTGAVVLGVGLIGLSLAPMIDGSGLWGRVLAPWGNWDTAGTLGFQVDETLTTVSRETDVLLTGTPRWRFGTGEPLQDVQLSWESATDHGRRMMVGDAEGGRFRTTLKNVQRDFRYRIASGTAISRWYDVKVVDPPELLATRAVVTPASYTGEPSLNVEGRIGELPMVAGSRVQLAFTFSKPIAEAKLLHLGVTDLAAGDAGPDGETVPEAWSAEIGNAGTSSVEFSGTAVHSSKLQLVVRDIDGLDAEWLLPARIRVVDDLPPRLLVDGPTHGATVRPDARLPITVTATDDYSVEAVELHWETPSGAGPVMPVPAEQVGQAAVRHAFNVDLTAFTLAAGETIRYRVRAVDNLPVPSPQETWSETRELRIELSAQPVGAENLALRQERMRNRIKQLQAELDKNSDDLRELHADAVDEVLRNADPEVEQAFERSLENQSELRNSLQQVLAEMQQHALLEDAADTRGQAVDNQLAEAMQATEAVRTGEPRERIENLSRALDELDGAEQDLQELLNQFDRIAALERDLQNLERLAAEADQLADAAEQLRRQEQNPAAPAETNPQPPAPNPDDLQTRGEALSQELGDFLEQHSELLDAARNQMLDRLAEAANQADQLADRQQAVAEAFDRAYAANESADGQASPDGEPEANAANPGAPAAEPPTGAAPGSEPAADGAENQPAGENQRAGDSEQSPPGANVRPAGHELSRLQQEQAGLSERLARQTVQSARTTTAESVETTASRKGFEAAANSGEALSRGDLPTAAEQAGAAATAAQEAADRLSRNSAVSPETAEAAASLAADQQALAQRMQQAAGDATARQSLSTQAQQQTQAEAGRLAESVAELAENLAADPLGEQQRGQQAGEAAEQLAEAGQQMSNAVQSMLRPGGDLEELSGQAQSRLRRAAELAREAASRENQSRNDTPRALAENLVAACQCLGSGTASIAGRGNGSGNGGPQGAASSESTSSENNGDGSPAATPPNDAASSSTTAQAAESFRRAADLLSRAMNRPGSGPPQTSPGTASESSSLAQAGPQSNSPPSGKSDGGGGAGTTQTLTSAELAIVLQKAGRRQWGELPPKIADDIREAARKRGHDDYEVLINAYFESIAETAPAGDE